MKRGIKILLVIIGVIVLLLVVSILLNVEKNKLPEREQQSIDAKNELKQNFIDLPNKIVEFKVKVPPNTPSKDKIYFIRYGFPGRIELNKTSENIYTTKIELPEGSLIRYFYDRSQEGTMWGENHESFSSEVDIAFRYLYVSPELKTVEDAIAMWIDLPYKPKTGTIQGNVIDKVSGKPIIDVTVSAAGFHIGTDSQGNFEIENILTGKQNVVITTSLGDYKFASEIVEINENEIKEVSFELEPAQKSRVIFNLETTEDTPDWAVPRIAGNIYQLGATRWQKNNLEWKTPDRHIFMKKIGKGKYTADVDLYEGTYVEYTYFLGTPEKNPYNGQVITRGFVVNSSSIRNNKLVSWKEEKKDLPIIFSVTIPPNTPKTDRIFIDGFGGMIALDKISNNKHGVLMYLEPGRTQSYTYAHGISYIGLQGWEKTDKDQQVMKRELRVNNIGFETNDKVEMWRLYPNSKKINQSLKVKFIVSVPQNTLSSIYINGDAPELNNKAMTKISESLWEIEIIFSEPKDIEYYYTSTNNLKTSAKKLSIEYDGQFIIDSVNSWNAFDFKYPKKIIGVQLNDYWTPNFLSLLPSTLNHLQEKNIGWIDFPVIWYHTKINGKTKLSPRVQNQYIGGIYPTEDVISVAKEIKLRGMKLVLDGFIVEKASLNYTSKEAFKENDNYALYLLEIAKKTNADIVVLPIPTGYEGTNEYAKALIKKAKQEYSGAIAVNGIFSNSFEFDSYDYQKEADYVIYNFFAELNITSKSQKTFIGETGDEICCLYSSDASVSELKNAIKEELEKFKKAYDKYQKPILFNQLGFASHDGSAFRPNDGFSVDSFYPDKKGFVLDLIEQANLYEAFFQAIENEEYIAGGFSFGYTYTDFPLSKSYDLRNKPSEGVLSKYAYASK